jgi:hypothetical protein
MIYSKKVKKNIVTIRFLLNCIQIKPGLIMNIICIAIEIILINTLGDYIFNFSQFPDWAEQQALAAITKNLNNFTAQAINITI